MALSRSSRVRSSVWIRYDGDRLEFGKRRRSRQSGRTEGGEPSITGAGGLEVRIVYRLSFRQTAATWLRLYDSLVEDLRAAESNETHVSTFCTPVIEEGQVQVRLNEQEVYQLEK